MASDSQCHEVNAIISSKDMSVNKRKPTRCVINAEASNVCNHQSTQGGNCAAFKHPPRKCRAYGVICSKCKGRNHFANVCKGGGFRNEVYQLETDHSDDNGYLFVGTVKESKATKTEQKWQVIHVNGHSVNFKLDTGSEANVLPATVYRQMKSVKLEKLRLCCMPLANIKWSH